MPAAPVGPELRQRMTLVPSEFESALLEGSGKFGQLKDVTVNPIALDQRSEVQLLVGCPNNDHDTRVYSAARD